MELYSGCYKYPNISKKKLANRMSQLNQNFENILEPTIRAQYQVYIRKIWRKSTNKYMSYKIFFV